MRLTVARIQAWECPDMRDLPDQGVDQEQETIERVRNRVRVPEGHLAPMCRMKRRITSYS